MAASSSWDVERVLSPGRRALHPAALHGIILRCDPLTEAACNLVARRSVEESQRGYPTRQAVSAS